MARAGLVLPALWDRNTASSEGGRAAEGKQRLVRDEKGIAILSLSRTKRKLEKDTEYRNSQRPGYYTSACCHRVQNLK